MEPKQQNQCIEYFKGIGQRCNAIRHDVSKLVMEINSLAEKIKDAQQQYDRYLRNGQTAEAAAAVKDIPTMQEELNQHRQRQADLVEQVDAMAAGLDIDSGFQAMVDEARRVWRQAAQMDDQIKVLRPFRLEANCLLTSARLAVAAVVNPKEPAPKRSTPKVFYVP